MVLRLLFHVPEFKKDVSAIRKDKFCAGIFIDPWTKEEHHELHKPMISVEDFNQIQMAKKKLSNNATTVRPSLNPDFPLRRFVLCTGGHPYTGSWSTGRHKKYASYCCNKLCPHFGHTVAKDLIEDDFYEFLKKVFPRTNFLSYLRK